jgi:protease IV
MFLLVISVLANFWLFGKYQKYFSSDKDVVESFHSGSAFAPDKIAIIRVHGTIMPPLTERLLDQIEQAQKDDAVKGVLLTIDSPGGLVADSHQIYHQLQKLQGEHQKPVFVAMKRLAASGGYYIAMGAGPQGKIFAEPTTWTGSIGVIIPRYDVSGLAESWHIKSSPLKTGKYKDALSPFRELSEGEREIWSEILNESFEKFLTVIDENRPQLTIHKTDEPKQVDDPEVVPNGLELVAVDAQGQSKANLATGRIFTANQALANGLVDEIGFEDEALAQLQEHLGLEEVRIVNYKSPVSLWEALLGLGKAQAPEQKQQTRLDAAVPQAMYYFSWVPPALPMP